MLLLECHLPHGFTLVGLNNLIDTEVSGAEIIPSAFSIELIQLCSKFFWWLVIFNLVHAVVVLIVHLVHVVPANFNVLKHDVVRLESLVKEFLSVLILWVVKLVLLLVFILVSSSCSILSNFVKFLLDGRD